MPSGRKEDSMHKLLKEKRKECLAVISCIAFLLVAHSYRWMNSMYNHDSLLVIQEDHGWQISLGRIFNPLYVWLRGEIVAPGNVALMSSLFLILSAVLCIRILKIRKTLSVILCCGFLTTFETLAFVNASFLLSLDLDMLALLFATLGAYCLTGPENVPRNLAGIVCVTLSLGLFQSYIEITILLICFVMLRKLLEGEKAGDVFAQGVRSAVCLLIAGIAYYLCLRVVWSMMNVSPADTRNGLAQIGDHGLRSVLFFARKAWLHTFEYLFRTGFIAHRTISSCINRVLFAASLVLIARMAAARRIGKQSAALSAALLFVMPLGGNCVYVLAHGLKHGLMTYSFALFSVFVVMIYDMAEGKNRFPKFVARSMLVLCSILVLNHILYANQIYTRYDLEAKSATAFMNRLIIRMEDTEGYETGLTPVAILGHIDDNRVAVRKRKLDLAGDPMAGATHHLAFSYYRTYRGFFDFVMGYPINLVQLNDIPGFFDNPEVQRMSVYPAKGSVCMVDGTLVVRLSEDLRPEEYR